MTCQTAQIMEGKVVCYNECYKRPSAKGFNPLIIELSRPMG